MDIVTRVDEEIRKLEQRNPGKGRSSLRGTAGLGKVLIANRGEIAKRFFLSLKEERIPSVAIVTDPDIGQSWYEMADDVVFIGPAQQYTSIPAVIAAAIFSDADAIYPGYGFLSENAAFVEAIAEIASVRNRRLIFMGPDAGIMHRVGDKLDARALALSNGVPVFAGTDSLAGIPEALVAAESLGYPVMVKLNAGGGGKGMQPVFHKDELPAAIESCRRIGTSLYNDSTFYLEKLITEPIHIEVQIFNATAIGIRKCAVQRRNQKIVEESGEVFLDSHLNLSVLAAAENMARISGYENAGAGTVEFLYDPVSRTFGFLEMNTRLQVEHPVTDQSLGIDLAKWQILHFDGRGADIPFSVALEQRFVRRAHAIECRIYAEDPENNYAPAPGKIAEIDLPTFNGVRCDFGFNKGDTILPDYDPLVGKVITWGADREEAIVRMERALSELYIRGVTTNIPQLLRIIRHEQFRKGNYSNKLLDTFPEITLPDADPAVNDEAACLGALISYIRQLTFVARESLSRKDIDFIATERNFDLVPMEFTVDIGDLRKVTIFAISPDRYRVYSEENHFREMAISSRTEDSDDYLVTLHDRSLTVRADFRPAGLILRYPDTSGSIHYYRMRVISHGSADPVAEDIGQVRARFQGTFVKFAEKNGQMLRTGIQVEAGEPVIVMSAMKMESTITAPISGTITYLIDNGDLSRLQIGKTSSGLIIGRPVLEGEVLFRISDRNNKSNRADTTTILPGPYADPEAILENTARVLLGLEIRERYLAMLSRSVSAIDDESLSRLAAVISARRLSDLLLVYCNIRSIYSPASGQNLSYYADFARYFENWGNPEYQPSEPFRSTFQKILAAYGYSGSVIPGPSGSADALAIIIIQVLRAHRNIRDNPIFARFLVRLAAKVPSSGSRILHVLRKMLVQEESERDDSLAEIIRGVLSELGARPWNIELVSLVAPEHNPAYERITALRNSGDHTTTISKDRKPLKISEKLKLPAGFTSDRSRQELYARLRQFADKYTLYQVEPEDPGIFRVLGESEDGRKFIFLFAAAAHPEFEKDSTGQIYRSPEIESAFVDCALAAASLQKTHPQAAIHAEIFTDISLLTTDLHSPVSSDLNYDAINRILTRVAAFFGISGLPAYQLVLLYRSRFSGTDKIKRLHLSLTGGHLALELAHPSDQRQPWSEIRHPRDSHLFERGKWPVEVWVEELFDSRSVHEIRIPCADEQARLPGSRIFFGKTAGIPLIAYFKDSRIAGGATGDLEGKKYIAACYMAFVNDLPLYVFNDGAGANIKEGMVSLNRAGEGFFWNTILGSSLKPGRISEWIARHPDPDMSQIIRQCDVVMTEIPFSKGRAPVLVAVGTGSSTGLDVYGSSQAALQMIVDSEHSYRVLTGANVIKSVLGEDVTNYNIGGARVMGRLTGTVDLVASGNLQMIMQLRAVQSALAARSRSSESQISVIPHDPAGDLSAEYISTFFDDGFWLPIKSEYYGAGSLFAGISRIDGYPVAVLAPRSGKGIRSFSAITKAREILQIARKCKIPVLFLIRERFLAPAHQEDENVLRAREDFFREISGRSVPGIMIALDEKAVSWSGLTAFTDFVVYAGETPAREKDRKLIDGLTALQFSDVPSAISGIGKLLDILITRSTGPGQAKGEVRLPDNPALPFDIFPAVINPLFDADTFTELYGAMNDRNTGPSLITGIARLNGVSVGVIADQPAILGGAPDAGGTDKYRYFTEWLNLRKLPVVVLNNAPGFIPGTRQERLRIQQIGARSLDANIASGIPVVSVVLNQNYGGRQIQSFSRYLRPGIVYLAYARGVMAVMGGLASFDLFNKSEFDTLISQGKIREAEEMRDAYLREYNAKAAASADAASTGILDWVIDDIKDLRAHVIKGLDEALRLAREMHNIIPW